MHSIIRGTSVDSMAYLHSNLSSGIKIWGDFWGPWGHISEGKKVSYEA